MVHQRLVHHFTPHHHEDGGHHLAHGVSLLALVIYLQVLIIFGAGLWLIKLKAPQILGTASYGVDQIVALTNARRAENGLQPLVFSSQLAQAAQAKANDMLVSDYWAHTSPSGKSPWSFIITSGYRYIFAGENLARDFSDAASVVAAWMNSPSHRSNILDKNFKEIGVAVTNGKLQGREGILVVQMFGSQISQIPTSEPLVQASPTPEISPIPTFRFTPEPVVVASAANQTVTVLASQQFSITKIGSLALVGLIFFLFVLEVIVSVRRADLTLRSGVIAHLGLLAFVLLALWYAVGGAIL